MIIKRYQYTDDCVNIIKKYEPLRLNAELIYDKVWVIGYGHTGSVQEGDTCTIEEAEAFLIEDLKMFSEQLCIVLSMFRLKVTQNQFDALLSLTFHVGINGTKGSFVLDALVDNIPLDRKINKKDMNKGLKQIDVMTEQFTYYYIHLFRTYITVNGKFCKDTYNRRTDEGKLFLGL